VRRITFDGLTGARNSHSVAADGVGFDDNQAKSALMVSFLRVTDDGGVATVWPSQGRRRGVQTLAELMYAY
jgi:hypothetical protein